MAPLPFDFLQTTGASLVAWQREVLMNFAACPRGKLPNPLLVTAAAGADAYAWVLPLFRLSLN
jgi:hypothetical protein